MVTQYLKRGSSNVFTYAFSSALVRAIGFIFLPYFLSQLTLSEFGVWDFYQMFFSMGTMLLTSCAATGMIRFFLLYKDDPLKQQQAIGNALLVALVGVLLLPIAVGALFFMRPSAFGSNYIFITALNVGFFALFSMVLAFMRMREKLLWYVLLFCGQNVLATGLTVWLVSRGNGVWSFFYASSFSYALFLPFFFSLLYRYRVFSTTLFKEQMYYSLPLLVYGFIYTGFFSIDRFFITYGSGFEALGAYGLLGRFGALFQFGAIALMDAWPVVLFNAQKEKDGDALIVKLISYFLLILTTGGLISVVASSWAMHWFLAEKYWGIAQLLALYFLPLVMLEVARLLQVGFALSTKTFLSPLAAVGGLGAQAFLLWMLSGYQLVGVMLANAGAFLLYGVASAVMSRKSYNSAVIDVMRTTKVMGLFCCYMAVLHQLLVVHNLFQQILLLLSWPVVLWFMGGITSDEKVWVMQKIKQTEPHGPVPSKNILYLRTDINFQEIKAGGSVAHTLGVINGFKALGYNVLCASSSMQSTLAELNLPHFQTLKVYPLFIFLRWKLGHLRWRLDCLFANLFFSWQVLGVFRRYHLQFIYQRYSILNCVGLILSKLKKVPLVLEYNGSEVWVFNVWSEHRWFKLTKLSNYIERLNITYADYIVVVSQPLKDGLAARGVAAEKILVNPNGVDVDLFDPQELEKKRDEVRNELALQEKFVFGFVGTFSYWHGIEVLAHMIPLVVTNNKRAHFLLIGDGPLKGYLVNVLGSDQELLKHVTFTGLVPQKAAKNYLAACDAFLCPTQPNKDGTRFFGSPTKIFEYMSLGKPIIASNLEQIADLLSPGLMVEDISDESVGNQVGILVQADDFEGFYKAAQRLLEIDTEVLRKVGGNARTKAVENYSWKKHVENIKEFVQEK